MRLPPFQLYTRWLSGLGLFLSGAVVGSAVYMSIQHHAYTVLAEQNLKLKEDNERMKLDLTAAKNTRNKNNYISSITVNLERTGGSREPDAISAGEIEKKIYSNLGTLRGKPSSVLRDAALSFYTLVEQPSYKTSSDKIYKVQVKLMMVVQTELIVKVTAAEEVAN